MLVDASKGPSMVALQWRRLHIHALGFGAKDCRDSPLRTRSQSGIAPRRCARARQSIAVLAVSAVVSTVPATTPQAQEQPSDGEATTAVIAERAFRLYRWQEDYSNLAGKERSGWEQFKYIPLPGLPGVWLSLGGEGRFRVDAYGPYLFGLGKSGYSWVSKQERVLQHLDLHVGQSLRAFVQVDTARENGRPVQRAYDQSDADVRQAFMDVVLPAGAGSATFRAGREELYLGASRWLAVRDPTNIRRSFDGFLAEYDDRMLTLRAFAAHPVNILPGAFDDDTSNREYFRGGYAILRKPFGLPATFDAYVYGRQQASATYARGTAPEDRWSGGARIAARLANVEAVGEATYQWGSFGTAAISAYGAFGDLGYRFSSLSFAGLPVTPKIGARSHYASGDDNLKSNTFSNFTGAYPAASVISEMSLISASNAANVQPYVQFFIDPGLVLGANWNFVRKVSMADSVYGPIGTLITAKTSTAHDVAQIGQIDLTWDVNRFLQVHALYAHVFAGQYIRDAGGRSFDYYRLQIMFRW